MAAIFTLFDKMVPKHVALGGVVDTDRYRSSNKAFYGLGKGERDLLRHRPYRFRPFAIRDGLLVTGQQQYSGGAAARLVIEALGR